MAVHADFDRDEMAIVDAAHDQFAVAGPILVLSRTVFGAMCVYDSSAVQLMHSEPKVPVLLQVLSGDLWFASRASLRTVARVVDRNKFVTTSRENLSVRRETGKE